MTEEPVIMSTSRSERAYQAAKSGYDLIHDFFTNKTLQTIFVVAFLVAGNLMLGSPLKIEIVLIGFFITAPFAWLLFPNASFSWTITTDLKKRIVHVAKIPLSKGHDLLSQVDAQQLFRDRTGKTTIVYGQNQAISKAVHLSDLHYLNDVTVLHRAMEQVGPLVEENAELKTYRGFEVAQLAAHADEARAKATASKSSDAIKDLKNDDRESTPNTSEAHEQEDTDSL